MLTKATAQQAKEVIATGEVTVVKFGAVWCAPCKMQDRILETMDIAVLSIDIDEDSTLASTYGVMAVPTIVILKDGVAKYKKVGLTSAGILEEAINAVTVAG